MSLVALTLLKFAKKLPSW